MTNIKLKTSNSQSSINYTLNQDDPQEQDQRGSSQPRDIPRSKYHSFITNPTAGNGPKRLHDAVPFRKYLHP